jgi:GTP cyclohydrolase II
MSLSALFGKSEMIEVTRGLAEFRALRPVEIVSETKSILALPVEGLTPARLAAFQEFCGPAVPRIVVTARRAVALGMVSATPVVLQFVPNYDAEEIVRIAANATPGSFLTAEPGGPADVAAVELAKLAQVLPAVLRTEAIPGLGLSGAPMVQVSAGAVAHFHGQRAQALSIAGEAEVPLASGYARAS